MVEIGLELGMARFVRRANDRPRAGHVDADAIVCYLPEKPSIPAGQPKLLFPRLIYCFKSGACPIPDASCFRIDDRELKIAPAEAW